MSDEAAPGWGPSLYKFMRSMKLAIVLILFITFTSIIATLIPQKQGVEAYLAAYPRLIAWLVVSLGFDDFFGKESVLFLVPSALFFINLATCTFHRFRSRLISKARRRYGPDILHVGLLIMIVGGIVTAVGREEGFAMLSPGEKINIPGGFVLTLDDFQFEKYEDGAPKDWISTVSVEKEGELVHEAFPIEVNKPMKIGNVKLYQSSYDINAFIILTDPDGNMYQVMPGQMIPLGEEGYILRDVTQDHDDSSKSIAHFDHWKDHEIAGHYDYAETESIGIYTITRMESTLSTGLQMVIDPGYYPILIGLLLLTLGLFITYIQKIGDSKL